MTTKPLVFASPTAVEEAARLRLDGCLENRVEAAIRSGAKRCRAPYGMAPLGRDERVVFVTNDGPGGVVARLRRTRSPLKRRPAWLVVRVVGLGNTTLRRRRTGP